jgi:sigma-E factor negative regulatory protein RseA
VEMMAAHKQFGGTSALQMPSGFLRNATFETQQR